MLGIRKGNNNTQRLTEFGENLEKNINKSSTIDQIKKAYKKELFGVLNGGNHIHMNLDFLNAIRKISTNLDRVKSAKTLEERIKSIELTKDDIKVNDISIINTNGTNLPHNSSTETMESIEKIKKSKQNLDNLNKNTIPTLEERLKSNIQKLSKIRDEQKIFNGEPRKIDKIEVNLKELQTLKKEIKEIQEILSNIKKAQATPEANSGNSINAESSTPTETDSLDAADIESSATPEANPGDDADAENSTASKDDSGDAAGTEISTPSEDDSKSGELNKLLDEFASKMSSMESRFLWISYDFDLYNPYKIGDNGTISNPPTPEEIEKKQDFFSSLMKKINKRIDEREHEQSLRKNIDELSQSQANTIDIPDGFLPFGYDDIIASGGTNKDTTNSLIEDFEQKLKQLKTFKKGIKKIRKRYKKNIKRLEEIKDLQEFHENIKEGKINDNLELNEEKIESIIKIGEILELESDNYNSRIQDQVIRAGKSSTIKLDFLNFKDGKEKENLEFEYSLYSKEGEELNNDQNGWKINLGKRKEISLKGITFDNDNQIMKIENLDIEPIESISFPLKLNLNVNINIKDTETGVIIDHHKPIYIEIPHPNLSKDEREKVYDSFHDGINDEIDTNYNNDGIKNIENEIIREILCEGLNKSEIKKINRKNIIKKIRDRLAPYLSSLKTDDLKNQFKEDMISEDRDVPFKYLLNKERFNEYIQNNWKNSLKEYTKTQIYENISKYREDILLCSVGPQELSKKSGFIFRRHEKENNNYTKFLKGKTDTRNCSCKIPGSNRDYKLTTEVKGVNSITATINSGNITIDAKNHDELIEKILSSTGKCGDLHERLRCDIALSVLKSMIKISPQKINRRIPNEKDGGTIYNRIETSINGDGKLILQKYGINGKDKNKNTKTIFYENTYIDKSGADAIKDLKKYIWQISTEINIVMNSLAQDYQRTIYEEDRSLLKYSTEGHFKGEDIKKWLGKLRHGETNYNFDFYTTIRDLSGKDVHITFNQGKFTFQGEFEGENYTYEANNLGDILKKTINNKRIFDGIELTIINSINKKYIEKLMENKLINNKNYFVSDLGENRSGRIYIFKGGNLYYLEVGNEGSKLFSKLDTGQINSNDIPNDILYACNPIEEKEFFENPLLAGKLIKEMHKPLKLFSSSKKASKSIRRKRRRSIKRMSPLNQIRYIKNLFKKSTSKLLSKSKRLSKIHKKENRYTVSDDYKGLSTTEIKNSLKIDYNTDQEHFQYKMRWNLEFTADYLNGKISAKKYLKNLGLSLDGLDNEEIKAEAKRRSDMYKQYLKDNSES